MVNALRERDTVRFDMENVIVPVCGTVIVLVMVSDGDLVGGREMVAVLVPIDTVREVELVRE